MLVLLVVLFGRGRARRYPMFTISIVLIGLNMLAEKLLANRVAPLVSNEIFLVLADLQVIVALLLVIELARQAFSGAKWPGWAAGSLVLLGGAAAVIAWWGQWPPAKMMLDPTTLGHLHVMQLLAQKGDLFNEALAVELFVLVVIAGRRFKTGWRSHTQQILAGIATNSAMLIIARVIWEKLARNPMRTRDDFNHNTDLQTHLQNAYGMVVLAVMVWWIICLWIDEPGAATLAPIEVANSPAAVDTLDAWIQKPSDPCADPKE
jgi:hypothetical protein